MDKFYLTKRNHFNERAQIQSQPMRFTTDAKNLWDSKKSLTFWTRTQTHKQQQKKVWMRRNEFESMITIKITLNAEKIKRKWNSDRGKREKEWKKTTSTDSWTKNGIPAICDFRLIVHLIGKAYCSVFPMENWNENIKIAYRQKWRRRQRRRRRQRHTKRSKDPLYCSDCAQLWIKHSQFPLNSWQLIFYSNCQFQSRIIFFSIGYFRESEIPLLVVRIFK